MIYCLLLFLSLFGLSTNSMVYNNFRESTESCVSESYVEEKSKKNYFNEYGYAVFCLDDFCRGDFINDIIDVYGALSIMYDPPYDGFSVSIQGNIFDDIRYVPRASINSTDYGYNSGLPAPTFTYTCLQKNRSAGAGGLIQYSTWKVSNDINSNYANVNLFSYISTSWESYFYLWEVTSTNVDGVYVAPVSQVQSPNLYKLLFENDSQNDSYNIGYLDGTKEGNYNGYQRGYADGYTDGAEEDETAVAIFTGIVEVGLLPVNVFLKMFEYEVFGINISALVSALITVAIVVVIIRIITGKKDD